MNSEIFDEVMCVYAVYDTVEKKYWQTPKGKKFWKKANHAKNAVNANPPKWMKYMKPISNYRYPAYYKFSEQDRLVIVEASFALGQVKIVS